MADLRVRCECACVPSHDTAMIVRQTEETLRSFMERIAGLDSVDRRMRAVREITGDGYSIRIVFDSRRRRTVFRKLADVLRGGFGATR